MNGPRVLFLVHAAVGLIFGLFFVFAAGPAIASYELGEATLPALLFARSEGVALIGLGLINAFTPGTLQAPFVRAVAAANVILHAGSIAVDFSESYGRNAGVWVGLAVHLIFALAFLYVLMRGWRIRGA